MNWRVFRERTVGYNVNWFVQSNQILMKCFAVDIESQSSSSPDKDLVFSLFRARQSIYRLSEKEVAKYGVTLEQATVMRLVKANGAITLDDICHIMIREHHTISSLIQRMANKQLVFATKGNRGRIKLALTKKGDEIVNKIEANDRNEEMISVLSKEEQKQLASYLKRITDTALQKANKPRTQASK